MKNAWNTHEEHILAQPCDDTSRKLSDVRSILRTQNNTLVPLFDRGAFLQRCLVLEKEIIFESNSSEVGKDRTLHELAWIRSKSIDDIMIIKYVLHGYLGVCYY